MAFPLAVISIIAVVFGLQKFLEAGARGWKPIAWGLTTLGGVGLFLYATSLLK